MDALSEVLRVVELTGGVFLETEFTDPWCVSSRVEPQDFAPMLARPRHLILYHYVLEGRLELQLLGQPPFSAAAEEVSMK